MTKNGTTELRRVLARWAAARLRPIGRHIVVANNQAPCPADLDGDGFVTGDDFTLFVTWFEAGTSATSTTTASSPATTSSCT